MKKIVLAGGSGYLGRTLIKYFAKQEVEFVVLTRNQEPRAKSQEKSCEVMWDAKTLGAWAAELEGADALINLTGRNVNTRYTDANKKTIMESRTLSTKILGEAMQQCKAPPRVWLNASSATLYRYSEDKEMDEDTKEYNDDFSTSVVRAWEQAFNEVPLPGVAKFTLRISIVLGNDDGAFPRLKNLARFGLGGTQGHGRQYVSWIHEEDLCRIIEWCMNNPQHAGAYNCTAPHPIANQQFMRELREAMHMPIGLPAAEWMLAIGARLLGTETELILKSRRVVPKKLLEKGFRFNYATATIAFNDLV